MRVLVTGAYGFIGSACLARLHGAGHAVVGAGRSINAARRRFPYAQWVEADFTRLRDAAAWLPFLDGIDAVVNCVGVLQDGAGDDVQRVQYEGTVALFEACERVRMARLVHISAIGAEEGGPSAFSRSKAAAEAHLKSLPLDWAILRPAVVLGSAVYGGTALLRAIAAFPGIVPVLRADARLQIVGLDDVALAVVRALAPGAPANAVWDVAHPQVHTLGDIATAIRAWLGFAPRPVLRLPLLLEKIIAPVADAIGWLGWRSPARSTSLAQLAVGVAGDPGPWMAASAIQPRSLDEILAERPASVQDRWFARLYLLKPIAIAGLAVIAIASGIAELASAWHMAASHAFASLLSGAIAIVIGLGIAVRATTRLALVGWIAFTVVHAAYTAVAAGHPGIGALGGEIAMLLATLFTLAILGDR